MILSSEKQQQRCCNCTADLRLCFCICKNTFHRHVILPNPGPSCSKLTMLLVNDSLKFQMAIIQIHCYFLLKKCENPLHNFFSTKNNSVFAYVVGIY